MRNRHELALEHAQSGLLLPAHLVGMPPAERLAPRNRVFYNAHIQELYNRAVALDARASLQSWQETLIAGTSDGPTLTAAAAASCIPTTALITLPNNYMYVGRMIKVTMQGRISCVVTTPGTARFDLRLGGTVVADSTAMNLNVVAKTNVPFWLELVATCRAIGAGTAANLFAFGQFTSEAVVGSAANTAGSNGTLTFSGGGGLGAPAAGAGFNSLSALTVDMFFTQTVATGSLTVHQFKVESLN